MAIHDFLEEVKKRTGGKKLSPVRQEVHELAQETYFRIKDGDTHRWAKEAARMLVRSIAPDLSPADTLNAAVSIEGIAIVVLSDFFSSGVLIKREAYKDEAREQKDGR